MDPGALVAERLARSPLPTRRTGFNPPTGSLPDFRTVGRCRWSAGFIGDVPFPLRFHSGAAPYSPRSPSSALKTSLLRAAQISSLTHPRDPGMFLVTYALTSSIVRLDTHVRTSSGDPTGNWTRFASGISRFPPPFHSGAAPYSPQSPSIGSLKTSLLRAATLSLSSCTRRGIPAEFLWVQLDLARVIEQRGELLMTLADPATPLAHPRQWWTAGPVAADSLARARELMRRPAGILAKIRHSSGILRGWVRGAGWGEGGGEGGLLGPRWGSGKVKNMACGPRATLAAVAIAPRGELRFYKSRSREAQLSRISWFSTLKYVYLPEMGKLLLVTASVRQLAASSDVLGRES
ncbi:hypothetical protein PR048_007185 [Dryococelus australis]|uniref:Uncharacterized protein n=1 Tax=Dryococelus australis TaxID=614101 RepID=A0ABQ9ICX5_9NEOP|nr:hypothetical protein PR048_007185 [Dryococelus australis]